MKLLITYCPICSAEHSSYPRLTEREAVEECVQMWPKVMAEEHAEYLKSITEVSE